MSLTNKKPPSDSTHSKLDAQPKALEELRNLTDSSVSEGEQRNGGPSEKARAQSSVRSVTTACDQRKTPRSLLGLHTRRPKKMHVDSFFHEETIQLSLEEVK